MTEIKNYAVGACCNKCGNFICSCKRSIITYFIEDCQTHQWFAIEYGSKEIYGYNTHACGTQLAINYVWTNDPLKANRFESKEAAESLAKFLYHWELSNINWIVTEHEFIG